MHLHPSYMCKSLRCIPSCPVPVIALACMDPQPKRALARAASRHGAGSSAPCTAARMTARALRPRAGRPEFGLDVDNIRPIQVVSGPRSRCWRWASRCPAAAALAACSSACRSAATRSPRRAPGSGRACAVVGGLLAGGALQRGGWQETLWGAACMLRWACAQVQSDRPASGTARMCASL